MAAILTHMADHSAFDPEELMAMSTAFELSCADLRVFAGDDLGRQTIAMRIFDLARAGVTSSAALHRRVVTESRTGL